MTPAEFRQSRKSLGLTQGQLAALIGVDRRTVQKWEGAERDMHPAAVRLLGAYSEGYRPQDWPKGERE